MDLMAIRRKMLMASGRKAIDTSPKIAEYGKYFGRSNGLILDDAEWCYTDWILFDSNTPTGKINVVDSYASLARTIAQGGDYTYQYQNETGSYKDWFYGSNNFSEMKRTIGKTGERLYKIRWSIKIINIPNCYAYCEETGQIFFAGKNSPYYGYTNINDMPT